MAGDSTEELRQALGYRPPTMTLELSLGLARMKVELGEFVALVHGFLGAVQHEEVRVALREMMTEVRTSYDIVVEALAPFYELDSAATFSKGFAARRARYKSTYLKSSGRIRTSCGVIADKMTILMKRRGWLANIPLARRSYERLKTLCANWLLIDEQLAFEMDSFLRVVNRILDDVNRQRKVSEASAQALLADALDQIEGDIAQVRGSLEELERVSKAI